MGIAVSMKPLNLLTLFVAPDVQNIGFEQDISRSAFHNFFSLDTLSVIWRFNSLCLSVELFVYLFLADATPHCNVIVLF